MSYRISQVFRLLSYWKLGKTIPVIVLPNFSYVKCLFLFLFTARQLLKLSYRILFAYLLAHSSQGRQDNLTNCLTEFWTRKTICQIVLPTSKPLRQSFKLSYSPFLSSSSSIRVYTHLVSRVFQVLIHKNLLFFVFK